MATVVWTVRAQKEKDSLYFNGRVEYGVYIANKTAQKIRKIEMDLGQWPLSGHPEQLLKGHVPLYRARHINKRFKIIYWYDEPNDTVVIEDIWDSMRSPQNLTQRIQ